jgi:hypothetical protein
MFVTADRKKKVDGTNLVDFLSMIGLQLEWMVMTIIKKNKNLRMESVNTDTTYRARPTYLGLNPIHYYQPDNLNDEYPEPEGELKLY